jgi:siroheme synthase (precorrin-2 oxidase/ferrochelatase)
VSKKVPQSNRLPLVLALVGALVVLAGGGSVLARRGKGRAAA